MKDPEQGSDDGADSKLGMRIRLLRVGQRMSRESLGDAVGLSLQDIQKYEAGIHRVSSDRLEAIAAALHVEVSEFCAQDQQTTSHSPVRPADRTAIRLLKAFNRIQNPATRQKMVALVEEIAKIHEG